MIDYDFIVNPWNPVFDNCHGKVSKYPQMLLIVLYCRQIISQENQENFTGIFAQAALTAIPTFDPFGLLANKLCQP